MLLWECNYKVQTGYDILTVRDYVWSTSKPENNTIGHYWRTLFPSYTIIDGESKQTDHKTGMNLDARVLSSEYVR